MIKIIRYTVVCISFLYSTSLFSLDLPDYGTKELLRQQEREQSLKDKFEPNVFLPTVFSPSDSLSSWPEDSPCFKVTHVELCGIDTEKFGWILESHDPWVGQCVGHNGLSIIQKTLQNKLISAGYITTRIIIPAQNYQNGKLFLKVIPGYVNNIFFDEQSDQRANFHNALPLDQSDILNLRSMEQGLENFKRLPSVDVDMQIVPSERSLPDQGLSDIKILWKQSKLVRGSFFLDDSGYKTTGRYQGGLTLATDHLWAHNDLFYLSLNHDLGGGSEGKRSSQSRTWHYSLPFGYTLLGINFSQSSYYQTVSGATQDYRYSGKNSSGDIRLTHVLYRDGRSKVQGTFKGWARSSSSYIDDTEIEIQRRRTAGWETSLGYQRFFDQSNLDMTLSYKQGTGMFHSLTPAEELSGQGTSRPTLMNADIQWSLPFIWNDWPAKYQAIYRMQRNFTSLSPQDRFTIGGRYTVRGFDGENILSADRGWLIRNDLGITILPRTEIYLGVDQGRVDGPSAAYLSGDYLMGGVVGWRGVVYQLTYDAFIGRPIAKPDDFKTSHETAGFSISYTF